MFGTTLVQAGKTAGIVAALSALTAMSVAGGVVMGCLMLVLLLLA